MLPAGEVVRRADWLYGTLARDGALFIRPDSGDKEFTGQLVRREAFGRWQALLELRSVPLDELCVVASPERIDAEYRLIVRRGRVVTGSVCKLGDELVSAPLETQPDAARITAFAEEVLGENPPPLPPVHVLDVAQGPEGPRVLEVGCWCCANLYECDRPKLAVAVSEEAEAEFAGRPPR